MGDPTAAPAAPATGGEAATTAVKAAAATAKEVPTKSAVMEPHLGPASMRGLFDLPEDGLVSSLALTPDGCYIFAAFGGGEVRLYAQALSTVGAASRGGTIVAQIRSKGMFSNTKVDCHVEASEDGRFVFAGLLRGSSEMLALDISDLPRWATLPTKAEASLDVTRFDLNRRIRTYAHSDGKLKGFGASATVRSGPNRCEWGKEYRLFCGRGIKNIHVWSFKPDPPDDGVVDVAGEKRRRARMDWGSGGEWSCLYDTHTNGATVELVAFRNGGLEGISKSNDANVRVWDLSGEDRQTKPPFRDINNSKDTRIVFGDYAYGGTTVLSLVKLDAPAVANRMEIALPESTAMSPLTGRASPSSRGKRHCRMLKDLAGTQDGRHIVLVCSDGMVLYHRHTQAVNIMKLEPLEGLGVDEEDARPTVALSLAGRTGLPVLMIAGRRGRHSGAAPGANGNRGVEGEKALELMALPRSEDHKRQDAKVPRVDSLGRSLLAWPNGRRLTPEDNETDDEEDSEDEESGSHEGADEREGVQGLPVEAVTDGGGGDGEKGDNSGSSKPARPDGVWARGTRSRPEAGTDGEGGVQQAATAAASPSPSASSVVAVAPAAADGPAQQSAPETAAADPSPSTPVSRPRSLLPPPDLARAEAAFTTPSSVWVSTKVAADSPSPIVPSPISTSASASSPSPLASLAAGPAQHRLSTPGSSGRKRARADGATKSTALVSSPPARSPGGPSPSIASSARGGRRRRSPGARSPEGGSGGGGGGSGGIPSPVPSQESPSRSGTGGAGGAEGGDGDGGEGGREGSGGPEPGPSAELAVRVENGEQDTGTSASISTGGSTDGAQTAPGAKPSTKEVVSAEDGRPEEDEPLHEQGEANGSISAPGENDVCADARKVVSTGVEGADGGGADGGGADGGGTDGGGAVVTQATDADDAAERGAAEGSGAEGSLMQKRRRGVVGGAPPGKVVSSSTGKRGNKKRPREDNDKSVPDEGNAEEGETTVPAPPKRGRRGGAEESAPTSRGSGKSRRTNASLEKDARNSSGGGGGGGGGGGSGGAGGGNGDQLLLRDRRSRIAARALRSNGNLFDIGAMAKGMSSSWTASAERQEDLRVVYMEERDASIEPPAVPPDLMRFLVERAERRKKESTPMTLQQARRRYSAGIKLAPHSLSAAVAGDATEGTTGATKVMKSGGDGGGGDVASGVSYSATDDAARSKGDGGGGGRGLVGVSSTGPPAVLSRGHPGASSSSEGGMDVASAASEPGPDIRVENAAQRKVGLATENTSGRHQELESTQTEAAAVSVATGVGRCNGFKDSSKAPNAWCPFSRGSDSGGGGGGGGGISPTPPRAAQEGDQGARGLARDLLSTTPEQPLPNEAKGPSKASAAPAAAGTASAALARAVVAGTSSGAALRSSAALPGGGNIAAKGALETGKSSIVLPGWIATLTTTASAGAKPFLPLSKVQAVAPPSDGASPSLAIVGDAMEVDVGAGSPLGEDLASARARNDVAKLTRNGVVGGEVASGGSAIEVQIPSGGSPKTFGATAGAAAVAAAVRIPNVLKAVDRRGDDVRSADVAILVDDDCAGTVARSVSSSSSSSSNDRSKLKTVQQAKRMLSGTSALAPQQVTTMGASAASFAAAAAAAAAAAPAATTVFAGGTSIAAAGTTTFHRGKHANTELDQGTSPAIGPEVFPPPPEAVIDMGHDAGEERGSGGGAVDRLYGEHCREREAVARAFFDEQDLLRRRFLAAVDRVELDKAVESAGLELRNGCRAAQTLKSRLKTRWQEGAVLGGGGSNGGSGGGSRAMSKELQQASLRRQEQVKTIIADHKELARELLGRQRLEAGALQMSQEMEVAKGKAPPLTVRFAFPRLFEEIATRHGIKL